MVLFAISGFGIAGLAFFGLVLLVLVGKAVRPEGRRAERMTPQGNYVGEPPGFKKPPDDAGLL